MAIRSGTGGLKYPLPSQYQIGAQQSAAAASAGGSAAASTYGANRAFAANKMRVQADLANSAADRDFRAQSQMQEQGFRAQQNYYDREHQAGAQLQSQDFRAQQSELDRNFDAYRQMQGQSFQSNQAQLDRDFTTQRDQARFDQDAAAFERQRDAGIEEGIRAGKLELAPEAQMRLQKIDADRAAIAAQNNLTPEQKAEFENKAQVAEREILRTARAPRMPTGAEAFNRGTTYVDPKTGRAYDDPGEGRVAHNIQDRKPLIEQPDTSKEDAKRQKTQQDWLEKRADEYTTETNPATITDTNKVGKPYTLEEAIKKAQEDRAVFDKALGSQPPAAPPIGMGSSVQQGSGSNMPTNPPPGYVQGGPIPNMPASPPPGYVQGGPIPLAPTPSTNAQPPVGMGNSVQQRSASGPAGLDVMPKPMTSEDYAAIPSGATYLDQNGNLKRKK